MAEIFTKIDKAGTVVIPKEIRKRMGLADEDVIRVTEMERGVIALKKLDVRELARQLREELKGKDLDRIAGRVEEEWMPEQEKKIARFVVDTNVFVAAVKPFTKSARRSIHETTALEPLVRLISDDSVSSSATFGWPSGIDG